MTAPIHRLITTLDNFTFYQNESQQVDAVVLTFGTGRNAMMYSYKVLPDAAEDWDVSLYKVELDKSGIMPTLNGDIQEFSYNEMRLLDFKKEQTIILQAEQEIEAEDSIHSISYFKNRIPKDTSGRHPVKLLQLWPNNRYV